MRKLTVTAIQDIVSNSTSTELFNWLTGPLPTVTARYVHVDLWLGGRVNLKGRPVVQFSDDGINWTDTPKELDATYQDTNGWHYGDTWHDLTNVTGTTYRRFFRLGIGALNQATTVTSGAQAQLAYMIRPVVGRSITLPPRKVWTKASTVTSIFVATAEPMPSDAVGELRSTLEITAHSGDCVVQAAWRETDDPEDVSAWSSAATFGSAATAEGLFVGTTFTSLSPTKRMVQPGVVVKNATGSLIEACRVVQTLDIRRTT